MWRRREDPAAVPAPVLLAAIERLEPALSFERRQGPHVAGAGRRFGASETGEPDGCVPGSRPTVGPARRRSSIVPKIPWFRCRNYCLLDPIQSTSPVSGRTPRVSDYSTSYDGMYHEFLVIGSRYTEAVRPSVLGLERRPLARSMCGVPNGDTDMGLLESYLGDWLDPQLALVLIGVILLAVLGTTILFAAGVTVYARRRSVRHLLIAIILGILVGRSFVGLGTVFGLVPMTVHHLIEHSSDFLIAVLLLYAVYRSRTVANAGADVDPLDEAGRDG